MLERMTTTLGKAGAVPALMGASVLWGTTGTAQALAATGATPPVVGAARLLVGGLVLVTACLALQRGRRLRALGHRGTARWTFTAAGAAAVFQPAFFAAVDRTGVAVGTLVALGSAPVFCGVLARWWAGEKLPAAWALATACAVVGCALLVLPGADAAVAPAGVALAALAGGCYGVYTVSAKRLLGAGHDPLAVLAATLGLAAVLISPFLLDKPYGLLTSHGVLLVAWLGVGATAGAYLLFAYGLTRVPAATAGTLSLAEPLTAVALGLVVLGERPTLTTGTGAVLLLIGLTAATLVTQRAQRQATAPAVELAEVA